MKILTIGDSHAKFGWETIDMQGIDIVIKHINGKLMYSFGRDQLKFIEPNELVKGDAVVFCFGETDVRMHLSKHKEEPYEKIIDKMVEKYIIAINNCVQGFDGILICVYFITPVVEQGRHIRHVGTNEERKNYTEYMNKKLREESGKVGYIFIDLYDYYVNERGFMNGEMADILSSRTRNDLPGHHIKDTKPLITFIKERICQ
jgi:hypothetical protein